MHPLRIETEDESITAIEVRITRGGILSGVSPESIAEITRSTLAKLRQRQADHAAAVVGTELTTADPVAQLEWSDTLSTERVSFDKAGELAAAHRGGGHSDWRLPTIKELLSIVDYTRHDPAIDTTLFPNTPASYYWSSSPVAADPDCAWIVNFNYGSTLWLLRSNGGAFVRAVRSSSASQ